MSLTIREAERKIIAEWREWSEHRGTYVLADILEFHFEWLVKIRPDLLLFKCEEDRWQVVKSWIQNDEAIQAKLRKAQGA